MRHWLFLGFLVAACGGKQPEPQRRDVQQTTGKEIVDDVTAGARSQEYGCVVQPDQDPAACTAQSGCSFGPAPWCAGIAPPPDWQDQRADEACACTCEADRERCSMMP